MKLLIVNTVILIWSTLLLGQKEFVSIEATPNPVEKDQQLIITIKSNVEGQIDFKLPDEFEQSGPTQSGMSSSVKYSNGRGKVVRFSYQKLSGHFEDEGTYRIGPAKINGKNGTVESNVIEIQVMKRQNMISANPADNMNRAIFGIIEQSNKEIYEGQPLILEGKVYSQVDILQVERYVPFELEGPCETHNLQQSNQVTRNFEQVAGRNVMTFRIGKMLVFPEKTGTFEIDAFQTVLFYDDQRSLFPERTKIQSNESKVTVKPLPDGVPPSFIEGVGQFKLEASIDTNRLKQGEVLTLRIYVMGHGNLHNIEAPELKLPKGMVLYGDPEIDDSVTFTSRGAEGMKSFTYFIQANKAGSIQIPVIEAGYFDLQTEEYQVLEAKLPVVEVTPSDKAIAAVQNAENDKKEEVQKLLPPVDQDYTVGFQGSSLTGVKGVLWTCTPVALAFLLGFVVRTRKNSEDSRVAKQEQLEYKQKALDELEKLSKNTVDPSSLQEIKNAVRNYLALRFDVAAAQVNTSFIKSNESLSEDVKKELTSLFKSIDELSYSGGAMKVDGEHIANTAKRVINEI